MKPLPRILLPFNFTDGCVAALRYAYQFAAKVGADITLLHCTGANQLMPTFQSHLLLRLRSFTERYATAFMTGTGKDPMIECLVKAGEIKEGLRTTANEVAATLVISPANLILQSLTQREAVALPDLVSCPVLLVPEKAVFTPLQQIVFTLDVTDTDTQVLQKVQQIAQRFDAQLSLLHLHQPLDGVSFCQVQKAAAKLQQELQNDNCSITCLEEEDLLEGLNEFAATRNPDLFVMATRDTHLLHQYFSGRYRKTSAYHLHTPLLNIYQARKTPCSGGCSHCNSTEKTHGQLAAEAVQ